MNGYLVECLDKYGMVHSVVCSKNSWDSNGWSLVNEHDIIGFHHITFNGNTIIIGEYFKGTPV